MDSSSDEHRIIAIAKATAISAKSIIILSKNRELLPTRSSDTKLLSNPKNRFLAKRKLTLIKISSADTNILKLNDCDDDETLSNSMMTKMTWETSQNGISDGIMSNDNDSENNSYNSNLEYLCERAERECSLHLLESKDM